MKTSEQIDKLCEALSKAQGMFTNPEKNKTATIPMKAGGVYSYNYADLPETLNVTRKALSECGLSHVCTVEFMEDGNFLIGRLMHSSGQWIESVWLLPQNPDPKIMAGSITYGRRYLFNALVGIAADDDNDAGEVGAYTQKQKKEKPSYPHPKSTEETKFPYTPPNTPPKVVAPRGAVINNGMDKSILIAEISGTATLKGIPTQERNVFLSTHNAQGLKDLSDDQLREALAWVKAYTPKPIEVSPDFEKALREMP